MIVEVRRRSRMFRGSRKNVELSCHTGAHSEPHSSDPDIVDCPTQLICTWIFICVSWTQQGNLLIQTPLTYEWGQQSRWHTKNRRHCFTRKDLASSALCYWPGILLFPHHPTWKTSGASPHLSPNSAICIIQPLYCSYWGWVGRASTQLQLIIAVHKNPNTRFRSSYAICVSYDDNDDDNVDD